MTIRFPEPNPAGCEKERGFALILSILALMLLTFLGLTLATSTSTELTIATNYRWSQQAYYNAEAGMETAKLVLENWPATDFSTLLPNPRPAQAPLQGWPLTGVPANAGPAGGGADAWGNALRAYEGSNCDTRSRIGYGLVLNPAGTAGAPFQYVSQWSGQNLNGAFTIWVRRPLVINNDGSLADSPDAAAIVVTVEGIAPFAGNTATSNFAQGNRASRILQLSLYRDPGKSPCPPERSQTGASATGSGIASCSQLDANSLTRELGGATAVGGGQRGGPAGGLTDSGVQ